MTLCIPFSQYMTQSIWRHSSLLMALAVSPLSTDFTFHCDQLCIYKLCVYLIMPLMSHVFYFHDLLVYTWHGEVMLNRCLGSVIGLWDTTRWHECDHTPLSCITIVLSLQASCCCLAMHSQSLMHTVGHCLICHVWLHRLSHDYPTAVLFYLSLLCITHAATQSHQSDRVVL